jgi:hypothetical protein
MLRISASRSYQHRCGQQPPRRAGVEARAQGHTRTMSAADGLATVAVGATVDCHTRWPAARHGARRATAAAHIPTSTWATTRQKTWTVP